MNKDEKAIWWRLIAALLSFMIPGLGQILVQGRIGVGVAFLLAALFFWCFWIGWLIHIWAVLDAAMFDVESAR